MDKKRNTINKILYIILGVLLFYVFTSATVETTTEQVTHKVREPILTPVIVEKTMTVQEPYTEKIPISKEGCDFYPYDYETSPPILGMKGQSVANETTKQNFLICNVTVFNLENKSGVFVLESRSSFDQRKEIPAKGSVSFEWIHGITQPGDNLCHIKFVEVPKIWKCYTTNETTYKIITKYREVVKKENVTEYRPTGRYTEVEKTEPITKYKYYNRVFGYEQFFYLGY